MNNSEIFLSVIIPAYNEEKRLGKTLIDIDRYLSKQKYIYEIVVISDGSTDRTVKMATNFQSIIKNLKVIDNKKNHGKGFVVRQAMLAARGKYRLFMDADNATTIDHFGKMLPFFEKGSQIVIGSRDPKDAKGARQAVSQSFFKRLLGNLGNVLVQILAVWGIWDTQCGFKAFSAKAVEDIFSRLLIDQWGLDIEILAIAQRLGYKIDKIPVYWINEPDSKVGWKGYLRTLQELAQIKWNLLTDKYHLK